MKNSIRLHRNRALRVLAAFLAAVAMVACGGGGSSSDSRAESASPPSVSLFSSTLAVGSLFDVPGRSLGSVKAFRIGQVELTATAISDTKVTLRAPSQPMQGILEMQLSGPGAPTLWASTGLTVIVFQPMSLDAVKVPGLAVGDELVLTGRDLVAGVTVTVGGNAFSQRSVTADRAVFRADKPSQGPLVISSNFQRVVLAESFTVAKATQVSRMSVAERNGVTELTFLGENLGQVSSVKARGIELPFRMSAPDTLVASVPAGVDGDVVLTAPFQQVRAGAFSLRTDAILAVGAVAFGQHFMQDAGTPGVRLLAGDLAVLRLDIVSTVEGTIAPALELSATRNGQAVGTLLSEAPALLSKAVNRTSALNAYVARMPPNWVQPGTEVVAVLRRPGVAVPVLTHRIALPVDEAPAIDLLLVPMVLGAVQPLLPSVDAVRQALVQTLPVHADRVRVRVRAAAFTPTGMPASPSTADFTRALEQLQRLADVEAPGSFIYAMGNAQRVNAAGVGGWAYRPSLWSLSQPGYSPAGLGEDTTLAAPQEPGPRGQTLARWAATLVHELGHMLTRAHAPCGNALMVDSDYPYPGGVFGPQDLVDADGNTSKSSGADGAGSLHDVMGYCAGVAFSDYNRRAVQQALQTWTAAHAAAPQTARAAQSQRATLLASSTAESMPLATTMVVSGSIRGDSVTLNAMSLTPAMAQQPGIDLPNNAGYAIAIVDSNGIERRYALDSMALEDGGTESGALGFRVRVLYTGALRSIRIWQDGRELLAKTFAPEASVAPAKDAASWINGTLTLQWDARAWPDMQLWHVDAAGALTVAALRNGAAGSVSVDPAFLAAHAGGRWVGVFGSDRNAVQVELVSGQGGSR